MKKLASAICLLSLALTGCAAKKPVNYRFQHCEVVNTEVRDGKEFKDCDCRRGKEVGFDAKSKAKLVWCESSREKP